MNQQPSAKTIGARLRQLRLANKLTQEQLGEKCGVTKGMVSQWESDDFVPPTERLLMLRNSIDFSMDWLLMGEPSTTENAREDALLKLYRASDGRGQDTILRVAEQESAYQVKPEDNANGSAKNAA